MSMITLQQSFLINYLNSLGGNPPNSAAAAFYASLDQVHSISPKIARIIKLVLSHLTLNTTASGKQSLTKYALEASILRQAQERVQGLLNKYPLYPELDLAIVQQLAY